MKKRTEKRNILITVKPNTKKSGIRRKEVIGECWDNQDNKDFSFRQFGTSCIISGLLSGKMCGSRYIVKLQNCKFQTLGKLLYDELITRL